MARRFRFLHLASRGCHEIRTKDGAEVLERILQCELYASPGRDRLRGASEGGRFEHPHRDAEVSAVDKVEGIDAEVDALAAVQPERLDQSHVEIKEVAGAERVATD